VERVAQQAHQDRAEQEDQVVSVDRERQEEQKGEMKTTVQRLTLKEASESKPKSEI
jgi:hypothetical protein